VEGGSDSGQLGLQRLAADIAEMYSSHAPKRLSVTDEAELAIDVGATLRTAERTLGLTLSDMGTYVKTPIRNFEGKKRLPPGPIGFRVNDEGVVEGVLHNVR
jgi:hypothetical protein